jgi:4-amino-4-deoxy-L-arabinose transferase-like glycosyltransferase
MVNNYIKRETAGSSRRLEGPTLWWLVLLLFLYGFGQAHQFWEPDEPREAEIAREMYASGEWIIPRLNGRPFLEKPPLAHWGAALIFHAVGGASEKYCRVPSAFWGLVGALATAWLGTMLAGRTIGILAAFVLTTNVEWAMNSHMLHVDMPLAAGVSLSIALFWYACSSRDGPRKRFAYLGCSAAAGVAFLAKGTIGLVIPAAVFLAFLVWQRNWREMRRFVSPWNVAAFAAVAVPWIVLLAFKGGEDALRIVFWDNQVFRFLSSHADHAGSPFWFYLEKLFETLVPWSIFLLPALLRLVKPWGAPGKEQNARRYLIVLITVPFFILSVASAKRIRYALPLMPGFAVVIAAWLGASWTGARARWETVWRWIGFGCAMLVAIGSWAVGLYLATATGEGVIFMAAGTIVSALVAFGAVTYTVRTGGKRMAQLTVALVTVAYVAVLSPPLRVFIIDSKRTYGSGLAAAFEKIGPRAAFYGYRMSEAETGAVAFRRGATFPMIESPQELAEVLHASPYNVVYIAEETYRKLKSLNLIPAKTVIVARYEHPRGGAVFLRGKADDGKDLNREF